MLVSQQRRSIPRRVTSIIYARIRILLHFPMLRHKSVFRFQKNLCVMLYPPLFLAVLKHLVPIGLLFLLDVIVVFPAFYRYILTIFLYNRLRYR